MDKALENLDLTNFRLENSDNKLTIYFLNSPLKPFYIDFLSGKFAYRQQQAKYKKEALIKAIKPKNEENFTVLDLTAGLGRDSFILASMGCRVISVEKNKILYSLLQNAVDRLKEGSKQNYFWEIIHNDSLSILEHHFIGENPEVIYFDPIFPAQNKSAKVKKEAQILQLLAEKDSEQENKIFELALKRAKSRVVVKRSSSSEYLMNKAPDYSIIAKTVRFDVYTRRLSFCSFVADLVSPPH